AIRGTEFNLEAAPDGTTTVTLLEGEVALDNQHGNLVLKSGEQAMVTPGQGPRKTAVLNAINVIQWALYYPAVLDLDEVGIGAGARSDLSDSVAAYRSGDLLAALEHFPSREPASEQEKLYYAALLLAVGQVAQAEADLASVKDAAAESLRTIIATVKHERRAQTRSTAENSASQLLADSYYLQSQSKLADALPSARAAATKSPHFG